MQDRSRRLLKLPVFQTTGDDCHLVGARRVPVPGWHRGAAWCSGAPPVLHFVPAASVLAPGSADSSLSPMRPRLHSPQHSQLSPHRRVAAAPELPNPVILTKNKCRKEERSEPLGFRSTASLQGRPRRGAARCSAGPGPGQRGAGAALEAGDWLRARGRRQPAGPG